MKCSHLWAETVPEEYRGEDMEKQLLVVNNTGSLVGEGPLWDAKTGTFLFLDIRGKCIWKQNLENGKCDKTDLPQQIGCMAICENGDMLVALEDAVYRLDKDGKMTVAHQNIKIKGRRFNDGKVGPDGAFYVGTTDDNNMGAFYRLKDGVLTELFDGCGCSNGLEWTADGKHMYYIDTPRQMVEIFDFDGQTGELTNRRKFVDIPIDLGKPDGMTLDETDDLWVALWDGHSVIQIDKASGKIKDKISVPCPKASCCAFGGADLNELFITTAGFLDAKEYADAGKTFKIRLDVKGKTVNYYKY